MNVIADLYHVLVRALLAFAVAFAVTAGIGLGLWTAIGRRGRNAVEGKPGANAPAFPQFAPEELVEP